jgi:hypothetical protein
MTGMFNYNGIFFGSQSGGVNNQLFDTSGQTGSLTISERLTPLDTVGATATVSHFSQSQSSGSGSGSFTTPMGMINWNRRWTQQLNTTLSGGGMLLLPIDSTVPGQSTKTLVAPTITTAINYSSFSEALRAAGAVAGPGDGAPSVGPFSGLPAMYGSLGSGGILTPGRYVASLTYSYSYYPSYAFGAGATKVHIVGTNVTGGITSRLSGQVGMNYAHGSSAASETSFTYDTVGITVGARYLLGPILASLTTNWLYFSNSTSPAGFGSTSPAGFVSSESFSKEIVLFSLSYAFTGQPFFMDTFAYFGAPDSGERTSAPSGAGPSPSGEGPGLLKKE